MKPINQITAKDITDFLQKIDRATWIKISGIGAVVILFIILVIYPGWVDRLSVRKKLKDLEQQKNITQNLLRKQPQLIKFKEDFLKTSQEIKNRLYLPGESSLLLGVISKMAEESKISIVSSSPKNFDGKFPPPFNDQYEGNVYDFTVEGGYHNLAEFVSKIENYPKVLRIESYTVLPQEKSSEKHLAQLNVTAVSSKKAKA